MGLREFLAGAHDVARATVTFRANHKPEIAVDREAAAPAWLDGPVLDAVLFLYYTATAFYTLGASTRADELRQHLRLSALLLDRDGFEPFVPWFDQPGTCLGILRVDRFGGMSVDLSCEVPERDTNAYLLDSVLLLFNHAVAQQPTAQERGRLAGAVQTLAQQYDTVGERTSLRALKEAPAAAVQQYRPSPRRVPGVSPSG